jgi:hypothetical protein
MKIELLKAMEMVFGVDLNVITYKQVQLSGSL